MKNIIPLIIAIGMIIGVIIWTWSFWNYIYGEKE